MANSSLMGKLSTARIKASTRVILLVYNFIMAEHHRKSYSHTVKLTIFNSRKFSNYTFYDILVPIKFSNEPSTTIYRQTTDRQTTLDREIFANKNLGLLKIFTSPYFCRYDHSMKNSIGQNFTYWTKINTQFTLTLIICQRKYFACLIFVIDGDGRKFPDLQYGRIVQTRRGWTVETRHECIVHASYGCALNDWLSQLLTKLHSGYVEGGSSSVLASFGGGSQSYSAYTCHVSFFTHELVA